MDKSIKSSNRSRSHSRNKDDDFTAEEKSALRSILLSRQSNQSPNPSSISYLNSNNNLSDPVMRTHIGSVKNMNYTRNDYYNQQRALINTHHNMNNNSSLPPTSQHQNNLNYYPTTVHPSLMNTNLPPSHLIQSYSSSHSAFAYDPKFNY